VDANVSRSRSSEWLDLSAPCRPFPSHCVLLSLPKSHIPSPAASSPTARCPSAQENALDSFRSLLLCYRAFEFPDTAQFIAMFKPHGVPLDSKFVAPWVTVATGAAGN
jgi:hypothetical protein